MADRSITTPSSQVPKPGTLWPPPRTATVMSLSAAKRTAVITSPALTGWTIDRRPLVDHAVADHARLVVPIVIGSVTVPLIASRNGQLSIHASLLMRSPVAQAEKGVGREGVTKRGDARQFLVGPTLDQDDSPAPWHRRSIHDWGETVKEHAGAERLGLVHAGA